MDYFNFFTSTSAQKESIVENEIKNEMHGQDLTKRIETLKLLNKELEDYMEEDVTRNNPRGPIDSRIYELVLRTASLETEKHILEEKLQKATRDYQREIEKLTERIRDISVKNTELECQFRSMSVKLPQIEDVNNRQGMMINSIQYRFNNTSFDRIKETEERVLRLQETNTHLEHQLQQMRESHVQMTNDLEERIKQSAALESKQTVKITKLQNKIREYESSINDLQQQMEHMKLTESNLVRNEVDKNSKLVSELNNECTQTTVLNKEVIVVRNENTELRRELQTLKHEFHDLETMQ